MPFTAHDSGPFSPSSQLINFIFQSTDLVQVVIRTQMLRFFGDEFTKDYQIVKLYRVCCMSRAVLWLQNVSHERTGYYRET